MSADTAMPRSNAAITLEVVSVVLFTFLAYLTIGIPLAVLPGYVHGELGFGSVLAGLVISVQYLATLLTRPYAGKVIDNLGPKRAVLYGMLGCAGSGLLMLLSVWLQGMPALSLGCLLLGRMILGTAESLVGTGAIGSRVAQLFSAFGCRIIASGDHSHKPSTGLITYLPMAEVLAQADILSLHCPATPQTRGLVNAEALAKMNPGAILLNTARGALVDEEAVAAALHSGQLGFYGADAFVTEPLPQESPLRAEPHAILTPHIAWTTREALQNLMDITTRNLRTWLEGNGEHIVNR